MHTETVSGTFTLLLPSTTMAANLNGVNGLNGHTTALSIEEPENIDSSYEDGHSISQGLLHLPGVTNESQKLMAKLLAEDRKKHHCFWGKVGFHNHLNHHLLAAYDLGAPAGLLQGIYDAEAVGKSPINLLDRQTQTTGQLEVAISTDNWTQYLGKEKYYISFVDFFSSETKALGIHDTLEKYIFSTTANENGSVMLMRLVGLALHSFIQVGYGIEFHDPLIVAAGLAQTAVSNPIPAVFHEGSQNCSDGYVGSSESAGTKTRPERPEYRLPYRGRSLLSLISEAYKSDILRPVMPYDADALLSKRVKDALKDGRPEEIIRLSKLWVVDEMSESTEFEEKEEEMIWAATLLTFATGKHGRKPRLDFFLMHILTSSLFLPSIMAVISKTESKRRLLKAVFMTMFMFIIVRGRPRIDPALLMSYTEFPHPPQTQSKGSLGNQSTVIKSNPWLAIIASVLQAPDAHTIKSLRSLYYAAQRYGTISLGGAIGAFDENGDDTLKGSSLLDGTIFIRAAGILMDTLGWVDHGQKERNWDRSALGWDDAWKIPDEDF